MEMSSSEVDSKTPLTGSQPKEFFSDFSFIGFVSMGFVRIGFVSIGLVSMFFWGFNERFELLIS